MKATARLKVMKGLKATAPAALKVMKK